MQDDYDMEVIENTLEQTKKIQRMGFETQAHWEEFVKYAISGLILWGDRFMRRLAEALEVAELDDTIKIIQVWRQPCEQANLLYKIKLAREKAQNDTSCEQK